MRDNGFEGKVAIITGSSRGIGKATATALARRGAWVVLNGRNPDRLFEAENELKEYTEKVLAIQGDISESAQAADLIERTVSAYGKIDILINNAALSMRGRIAELDPEVYRKILDNNVLGVMNCILPALQHIRKTRGSILLISSLAAISGLPEQSAYSASKMALRAIAEALRIEEHESGIHVGLVRVGVSEIATGKKVLSPDGSLKLLRETTSLKIWSYQRVARTILRSISGRRRTITHTGIGKLYALVQLFCPSLVERVMIRSLKRNFRKTLE